MRTVEELEDLIIGAVEESCQARITCRDENLLLLNKDSSPANFLYVFETLERELGFPAAVVLEKMHFSSFTVRGLANSLYKMQNA